MIDRELRAYLLGQVSEQESARLEERLLEDDELYRTLEGVEDDLFDDHARGRLEPADRASFDARYGADGDRQRFARAFSARVDKASGVPAFRPRPSWRQWTPLAAAAAVILIAGGVIMMRRVAPMPANGQQTAVSQPVAAPEEKTAVFAMSLGTSRAAGDPVLLSMPADASRIEFRVRLNPADRFDSYAMELRPTSANTSVWRIPDARAAVENGDLLLTAHARAADVPDGAYELTVRGNRAGSAASSSEDLGFVPVKVVRLP